MFDAAAALSSEQLLNVTYYTRIALEHWFTPEDLRKHPLLAGSSSEPSLEEQELACRWLEEIQAHEGRRIDELDRETIRYYTGELSGMALRRSELENPMDPERIQRLLDELERAVPWPPLRRAS
ncbi:MAG TPA: hypothetical protein VLX28_19720 [Thermoanaerobaculia bacterium]|nr:hypothetical protein [Thermoanaerobaculia bacterium]